LQGVRSNMTSNPECPWVGAVWRLGHSGATTSQRAVASGRCIIIKGTRQRCLVQCCCVARDDIGSWIPGRDITSRCHNCACVSARLRSDSGTKLPYLPPLERAIPDVLPVVRTAVDLFSKIQGLRGDQPSGPSFSALPLTVYAQRPSRLN
jgi:hypothetical protein